MAKKKPGPGFEQSDPIEEKMLTEVRIKVVLPDPNDKYDPTAGLRKVFPDWEPPPAPTPTPFQRLVELLGRDPGPKSDPAAEAAFRAYRPGPVTMYHFRGLPTAVGDRAEIERIATIAADHLRATLARHGLDKSTSVNFDELARSNESELNEAATLSFEASYLNYLKHSGNHEEIASYLKGYCLGWLVARFEVRPKEETFRVGVRRDRGYASMAVKMSEKGPRKEIHELFKAEKAKNPKRTDEDIIAELSKRTGRAYDTVRDYAYKPLSRSRAKNAKKSVAAKRPARKTVQ